MANVTSLNYVLSFARGSVISGLDERLRRLEKAVLPDLGQSKAQPSWRQNDQEHVQGWYRDPEGKVLRSGNSLDGGDQGVVVVAATAADQPKSSSDNTEYSRAMGLASSTERLLLENPVLGNLSSPPQSLHPPLTIREISMILPSQALAEILFSHYTETVNWIYKVIHVPTVHSLLRTIYVRLSSSSFGRDTDPLDGDEQGSLISGLSLVACILATAAHFWQDKPDVPLTKEEAVSSCQKWSNLAHRCLSETQSDTRPSIETLQTTILMLQFIPGRELSAQRTLLTATVHMAHALGLHQTDSRRNCKLRAEGPYDHVEIEVRRRLWWHIVTNDWIFSYLGGPQSGTYSIHPEQMNVLYPANADDVDITPQEVRSRDFAATPTEMTYSISKIWMARAIRELVDSACKAGFEVDELEYDKVLESDRNFTECIQRLPPFFQIDETSRRQNQAIDRERPYIAWQRNLIHFGLHTRLARLHRPHLLRGYKDPKYAYSRMRCLQSARAVIDMERIMRETKGGFNPDSSRLWPVVHHYFMATVKLVMDYCYHRNDPQAAEKKQEILNCYRVLEKTQEESTVVRKGLKKLRQVMIDWCEDQGSERTVAAKTASRPEQGQGHASSTTPAMMNGQASDQTSSPETAALNEMPLSFAPMEFGVDVGQELWFDSMDFSDPHDPRWDALFWNLENLPGIYN
ncbi:MAG: hypothetical protein M1818_008266 [Claussenomyces sp. TS43310]|nr:MAG: hypothetical protein M1818_008266 [Claussenomyces sp. TS43310]